MTTLRTASPRGVPPAPTSGAVVVTAPPVVLPPEASAILLRIARAAIKAAASGRLDETDRLDLLPADPPAAILAPAAAFVTLHEHGALRGCIGTLVADRPLWVAVASAAVSAATSDPRFLPVAEREVPSLTISVSVLGSPVPLRDPDDFRPGVDGLIVERGGRRGLLLPEVADEAGWGAREMLEATCWKAGLPEDAWREAETRRFTFRTARVSEADDDEGCGRP